MKKHLRNFFERKDEMGKSNFENLVPEITNIAKGLSSFWNNKFEVNELVNEAWIKRKRLKSTDIPLILRRAKFDMIDYIRCQEGRLQSIDENGKKRYKPKHITNIVFIDDNNEEQKAFIFDRPVEDKSFLSLENKELIDILLEETTDREETVIRKYFLEEKSLKEVGKEMSRLRCRMGSSLKRNGLSDVRISLIKKAGLEKCRRKLETMNI